VEVTPNTNMNLRQTNNLYVERDVNA
jgi:hypothetical protein